MSGPLRVAVVGGGQNGEHDVSLASARAVTEALRGSCEYTPVSLTIGRDGTWCDDDGRYLSLGAVAELLSGCDVVFPAVHGVRGEDGALAALCEWAGVAYVGSGYRAGVLAMDKWVTKLVANAVGVRTAPGRLVTRQSSRQHAWEGPVVVKPTSAGSSMGVRLVESPDALGAALDAAFELDDRVLIERRIVGREIDVAVVADRHGGRFVSPALEILTRDGIFDHASKYNGTASFSVPARLAHTLRASMEAAAITVFDALGCEGVARVDFFVCDDAVILNEVTTMPGLTATSQLPRMLAAAGLDYFQVVDVMIKAALPMRREPSGAADAAAEYVGIEP